MKIGELASLFACSRIAGDADTEVQGIAYDSRKVEAGDLFICVKGFKFDGHQYAGRAVESGAAALVAEEGSGLESEVPVLYVKDTRRAMAVIANHFYGYPSRELGLIGVTGTNGKTTTAYIVEKLLADAGYRTGLMGTIATKIAGEVREAGRTTEESVDLQRQLARMREAGTDYGVMEVSSHALELGRVNGCRFRTAIFTNLTQDHLDFHGTMDHYKAAKGLFFSRLGNAYAADPRSRQYAVLNADDPASEEYSRMTAAQVVTYGIRRDADVRASDIRVEAGGTRFTVRTFRGETGLRLRHIGLFNVYNAMAGLAAALLEGIPLEAAKKTLEAMDSVAGRMERVDEGQSFYVFVDYAHTPDGLDNVLSTIRQFAKGKVLTVFGCGGDRDAKKRPIMGGIAARYSDYCIVTSDNPRSEDPLRIMEDVEAGIVEAGHGKDRYMCLADRKAAIEKAVEQASPEDVVLIAGKGHETYQEIGGVKHPFDDRLMAREAIRRRSP